MRQIFIRQLVSLLTLLTPHAVLAADRCDLALGSKIFTAKCAVCHTHEASGQHSAGPNLGNVIGRISGSAKGFPYSEAMRAFGRSWSKTELEKFLQQPMEAIPGTTMAFAGLAKPNEREAVICYLKQGTK